MAYLLAALIFFPSLAFAQVLVSPYVESDLPDIIKPYKASHRIADFFYVVTDGDEWEMAERWAKDPRVRAVQVDMPRRIQEGWQVQRLSLPQVWPQTQGNVVMAVCDSGVSHPDIPTVPGWNFYDNNADTTDRSGHGTKVAGAVRSVAPKVTIMPFRVTDPNGWGYDSAIANCIVRAADTGARGANASFGGICGSPIIQSAARYMRSKGGVVTASAGNTGRQDSSTNSPDMTCVGATDGNDNRTGWSTYGPLVDLTAPGENVEVTYAGGGYGGASGTSFSAPIVLGVYALAMERNPTMTPAELDSLLYRTALDLGTPGYDEYYGHGRVNPVAMFDRFIAQPQNLRIVQ